jgi:zinc D-Ala-D-Ala dipeptidase
MPETVLLSDPRLARVPVHDRGEPLVDLRAVATLRLDGRRAEPEGAYAHVRFGLVDRLVTAQSLLPRGIRLLIVEGYRPPALQERYFHRYLEQLRAAHPALSAQTLREHASRYIAPPEFAPHPTGGAVDLTLADEDGQELFMGTEVNATLTQSADACCTAAPGIPATARANRRHLVSALTAAGFVNHPTEWWHWSYGDRYWALVTRAHAAQYRPVDR